MRSAVAGQWLEGAERAREKLAELRSQGDRPATMTVDDAWGRSLHRLLGIAWPCPARDELSARWAETVNRLRGRGLTVGRGAYCGWDDADRDFAGAAWCLTRHLAPQTVVETGVARGVTSALVLEALAANEMGRLFSIDLPPWRHRREVAGQAGAAVAERVKGRWTLVEGSSRRRLPGLLRELGTIDLFIHDSNHSYRNVAFELAQAWRAVRPGGFLLVDDVHRSRAFAEFTARCGSVESITCSADDRQGMFGLIRKPAVPDADTDVIGPRRR